jgi:RNA polymerase sigma-70 factor (ECF subfamily)
MPNEEEEGPAARLMALLAPHHDAARATARRLCRSNADGDDLFQEAVLRAFDKLGELRDEGRFRAWFYAVLLSVHRALHRRSFWRRLSPLEEADEPSRPAAADALAGAERMAWALSTLSPEAREAIVLFELEGFSLEEIAAMQGESLSAIKSRLARARERLCRHYQENDGALGALATEKTP